jgi:glycosyltransferase involved in cell wall biosynthesis
MKKLLEASQKAIIISKAVAEKYINNYSLRDYRIIYDGINISDYLIEEHEILRGDEIAFVQIGRLQKGKGCAQSIHLIDMLKDKIPCKLLFAGGGKKEYVEELNALVEKSGLSGTVSFMPFTNDIKTVLKNSDVLIMASDSEGLGRVTIEGMLGGLLVIGKDKAGTKEIIRHRENGLLFKDEEEFEKLMLEVYGDRKKFQTVAQQGQQHAKEFFSPEKCAEQILEYLSD